MNKKILSFVCALIITVASGFSLGVSASENSMQLQNKFLNINSYAGQFYYDQFKDIGFTDEEILELYKNEADRLGIELKLPSEIVEKFNIEIVKPDSYTPFATTIEDPVRHSLTINFNDLAYELGMPGGAAAAEYLTRKEMESVVKKSIVREIITSAGFQAFAAATTIAALILGGISYLTKGVVIDYTTVHACDDYDGCKDVITDMSHRFF